MGYIYILENKINKKMYVGQTKNKIEQRLAGHKSNNLYIDNAIRKYGLDNFNIYKLPCDEEDLDYFEIGFIRQLKTLYPDGYNLTSGGNANRICSEETIKKLSKSHIGQVAWNKGIPTSEETKKKISEKNKISMIGINTWAKGSKKPERTIEHRKNLSTSLRKRRTWNKHGLKGVSSHGKKWRAKIYRNGKEIIIGNYYTKEEAYEGYCNAIENWEKYGGLNKP
jgi:group I intron endonuclease